MSYLDETGLAEFTTKIKNYLQSKLQPAIEPYLTFRNLNGGISLMSFTGNKTWDGTIEYSTDKENWTEWTGTIISSGQDIYLRGTGNTYITGSGTNGYSFQLNSNHRVSISGDIETLLDYQTVIQGNHPPVATYCFYGWFVQQSALTDISNLVLSLPNLTSYCYSSMFSQTSITQPAIMKAVSLSSNCCRSMYSSCLSLIKLPKLVVPTLRSYCYQYMFSGCSLIKISQTQTGEYVNEYRIPYGTETGTTASSAMQYMFQNTGGTFTSNPSINTIYYTSNDVV